MFGTWLLRISVAAALAAGAVHAAGSPPDVPAASVAYEVRPGETLWTIARRLDPSGDPRRTVEDILRLNDLSGPSIYPGQRLQVPAGA